MNQENESSERRGGQTLLKSGTGNRPDVEELTLLPPWLELPPVSEVAPPVQTRAQTLPFQQLAWKDFERLCVRLARRNGEIEHCQFYGVEGQSQEGIDLYARPRLQVGYVVYQCKRVEKFGPAEIRSAVTKFLKGKWKARSSKFVLCTSLGGLRIEQAEEIETQHGRLEEANIEFEVWDAERLSEILKERPDIVDDFFGRAWTIAFLGDETAIGLGARLDAGATIRFRRQLREFYEHVFNHHDPGIPIPAQAGVSPILLRERYVAPDVCKWETAPSSVSPNSPVPQLRPPDLDPFIVVDTRWRPDLQMEAKRNSVQRENPPMRSREPLMSWLSRSDRSVILGRPGSGKSSVLRYVALDLLSESPQVQSLAAHWGERLPVWLPFGYWTKLIASERGQTCSIGECLRLWLEQWNELKLWPLVQQAIEDERLLLLVDGLDEWTTEAAGVAASQMLQVFVERNNIAVLVTSRLHVYHRVGIQGSAWQAGELADLLPEQQAKLARVWFLATAAGAVTSSKASDMSSDMSIERRADTELERFIRELRCSSDLQELAQVPLLLSLLIYLWFQQVKLPGHRFEAYDLITTHLLETHPARRRVAALVTESKAGLSVNEVRDVLAFLAFFVQDRSREGVIDERVAEKQVLNYLTEDSGYGLGLDQPTARRYSQEFVSIAEGTLGILVRQGGTQLGFFHRTFQEYLAARHIARLDSAIQKSLIERYCAEPAWREVVLALFWLTKRTQDIGDFVDTISSVRAKMAAGIEAFGVDLLLAEIAFGEFNLGVQQRKRLATEAADRIEQEEWMPHRRRLLGCAMDGLRSTKTRELVRQRIGRWVYAHASWRSNLYLAMKRWPAVEETLAVLRQALYDEQPENQQAAAEALGYVAVGNDGVGDELSELALRANNPLLRAAALWALVVGWPTHAQTYEAISSARRSASPELRLAAIGALVQRAGAREEDLRELISLAKRENHWELANAWASRIPEILIQGWSGSARLKTEFLKAVTSHSFPANDFEEVDPDIAWTVLLNAFPHDEEVAKVCADRIRSVSNPFGTLTLLNSPWVSLRKNFVDSRGIVEAIDTWAPTQTFPGPDFAYAALVGRTPLIKGLLLSDLCNSSTPHWAAWSLLEGWGLSDPEVGTALISVVNGPADSASRIGQLVPRILQDPAVALGRLLEIFKDPLCRRYDFVISGLATLANDENYHEIAENCLNRISPRSFAALDFSGVAELIVGFPKNAGVRELALRELGRPEPPIAAVASAYGEDPEMRTAIAERASPLPAELRAQIVSKLSEIDDSDGYALKLLENYDMEADAGVKVLASISYHRRLQLEEVNPKGALDRLRREIYAFGPSHHERRQAAFAGLLVLSRLDVIRDEVERSRPSSKPYVIGLTSWARPNFPFVRMVLAKWDEMRAAFGEQLLARLSDWGSTDDSWEAICLLAPEFPNTHGDILRAIESMPQIWHRLGVLAFLAAIKPGSRLLLDCCLSLLSGGRGNAAIVEERILFAAQILAEQYAESTELQQWVEDNKPRGIWDEGRILALCQACPDSPLIGDLYSELKSPDRAMKSYSVLFSLEFSFLEANRLQDALLGYLKYGEIGMSSTLTSLVTPLRSRLKRDENFAMLLFNTLQTEPNPTAKATFSKAIALSRGFSPQLRDWCVEELSKQLNGDGQPEIGFDLFAGKARSVAHSLLELLDE